MWWHTKYPFRRNIQIVPADTLPIGHPVSIQIQDSWIDNGKLRADKLDVEILRLVDEAWVVQPSRLDDDSVVFDLPDVITETSDEYFLYYGNNSLTDAPIYTDPVVNLWPVRDELLSDNISFTRPGEHWINGVSSTAGAVAVYQFYGSKVRLVATVGPDQGIVEIQTDYGMWEEVDLFSSAQATKEVWSRNLIGDIHEVRVRVTGRQNPGSKGHEVTINYFEQSKAYMVNDLGEQITDLSWITMTGGGA